MCLRLTAFLILPAPDLDTSATEAYWGGANRLLHGVGFSDTSYPVFAPPLYAIFISLCLTLFGDSQVPVKIVQACVDAAMTIILYLIGREVFDARTGLLSAGIWAVYPFPIYLALTIASEPLFTLLLGIFVLLTIYAICSQRSRYYCAAGILLGLATLTRATTQFLPLMFPLMIFPFQRRGKAVLEVTKLRIGFIQLIENSTQLGKSLVQAVGPNEVKIDIRLEFDVLNTNLKEFFWRKRVWKKLWPCKVEKLCGRARGIKKLDLGVSTVSFTNLTN